MYTIIALTGQKILPPNYGAPYEIFMRYSYWGRFRKVIALVWDTKPGKMQITHNFEIIAVKRSMLRKILENILIGGASVFGIRKNRVLTKEVFFFLHVGYRKILKKILEEHPNAVVVFESPGGAYSVIAELEGCIKILRAHNVEVDYYNRFHSKPPLSKIGERWVAHVEEVFLKKCDLIFSITQEDMDRFDKYYGIPKKKMVWIPPAFPIEKIRLISSDEKSKIKNKMGLSGEKICVYMSGEGSKTKNWEVSNRLMNILPEKYPDITFIVMGNVCKILQVSNRNAKLMGVVDEQTKQNLLSIADMAINPPIVGAGVNTRILEYMAYGLPVITTPLGARGVPVQDGESAVIRDPKNFPDGFEFLLADGERARTIGLNARKIIEEHFSADVVARRAIEAIDRVWLEKYGK